METLGESAWQEERNEMEPDTLLAGLAAALIAFAGWSARHYMATIARQRELLHEERRQIYLKVLEPFFIALSKSTAKARRTEQIINSSAYRQAMFTLSLIGSDGTVHAVNEMMQRAFKITSEDPLTPEDLIRNFGGLLLEIRKDLGLKGTKLTPRDMLRSTIIGIDDIP